MFLEITSHESWYINHLKILGIMWIIYDEYLIITLCNHDTRIFLLVQKNWSLCNSHCNTYKLHLRYIHKIKRCDRVTMQQTDIEMGEQQVLYKAEVFHLWPAGILWVARAVIFEMTYVINLIAYVTYGELKFRVIGLFSICTLGLLSYLSIYIVCI